METSVNSENKNRFITRGAIFWMVAMLLPPSISMTAPEHQYLIEDETMGNTDSSSNNSAPVKRDLAQEKRNRALVIEWYDRVFNKQDLSTTKSVLSENYIQHNPNLSDGADVLINAMPEYWARNPGLHFRFIRSAAEGDLVFLHSHRTCGPADLGRAYVDIYRVVDGKIVEHWDVSQPVPEKSANDNTMF